MDARALAQVLYDADAGLLLHHAREVAANAAVPLCTFTVEELDTRAHIADMLEHRVAHFSAGGQGFPPAHARAGAHARTRCDDHSTPERVANISRYCEALMTPDEYTEIYNQLREERGQLAADTFKTGAASIIAGWRLEWRIARYKKIAEQIPPGDYASCRLYERGVCDLIVWSDFLESDQRMYVLFNRPAADSVRLWHREEDTIESFVWDPPADKGREYQARNVEIAREERLLMHRDHGRASWPADVPWWLR